MEKKKKCKYNNKIKLKLKLKLLISQVINNYQILESNS